MSELRSGMASRRVVCRRYRTPYGVVPWGSRRCPHESPHCGILVWDHTAGRIVIRRRYPAFAQTRLELADLERIFPGRSVVVSLGVKVDPGEQTFGLRLSPITGSGC